MTHQEDGRGSGAIRRSAGARPGLVEQLLFLEQRGATAAVKHLAIARAGLTPATAALIARRLHTFAAGDRAGASAAAAAPPVGRRTPRRSRRNAAGWALGKLGTAMLLWGGIVVGGLAVGYVVGFDAGLSDGVDIGLDRLQSALHRIALN